MNLPVRRTNQADADLDSIWLSIAIDSPTAAERLIGRLEAAESRLGQFPEIGQARPDLGVGIRHWPIAPYLIFYRVDPEAVTILRILHGARDLPRLFEI